MHHLIQLQHDCIQYPCIGRVTGAAPEPAQGSRTLFATNATNSTASASNDSAAFNESWAFYPDADPMRSFYAGDPRAAMTPFLAYKWGP